MKCEQGKPSLVRLVPLLQVLWLFLFFRLFSAHIIYILFSRYTFSAPSEMVRFQFIVGGCKLVRGRYDDSLSKWYTNAGPNYFFPFLVA